MGRFYRTTDPRNVDFIRKLPFELMKQVSDENQAKADAFEEQNLATTAILGKLKTFEEFNPALREKVQLYEDKINELNKVFNDNPKQWKQKQEMLRTIGNQLNEEMQTGDLGYMTRSYAEQKAKEAELRKNKDLNQANVDLALNKYYSELKQKGYSYDKDTGKGDLPQLAYLTKDFDSQAYLKDFLDPKNFKQNLENLTEFEKIQGGNYRNIKTGDIYTDKEAMRYAAEKMLMNNQDFKDYNRMTAGLKGNTSEQDIQNQIDFLSKPIEEQVPNFNKLKKEQKDAYLKSVKTQLEKAQKLAEIANDNPLQAYNILEARKQADVLQSRFNDRTRTIEQNVIRDNSADDALKREQRKLARLRGKKIQKELDESVRNSFMVNYTTKSNTGLLDVNGNASQYYSIESKNTARTIKRLEEEYSKATGEVKAGLQKRIEDLKTQQRNFTYASDYFNQVGADALKQGGYSDKIVDAFKHGDFETGERNDYSKKALDYFEKTYPEEFKKLGVSGVTKMLKDATKVAVSAQKNSHEEIKKNSVHDNQIIRFTGKKEFKNGKEVYIPNKVEDVMNYVIQGLPANAELSNLDGSEFKLKMTSKDAIKNGWKPTGMQVVAGRGQIILQHPETDKEIVIDLSNTPEAYQAIIDNMDTNDPVQKKFVDRYSNPISMAVNSTYDNLPALSDNYSGTYTTELRLPSGTQTLISKKKVVGSRDGDGNFSSDGSGTEEVLTFSTPYGQKSYNLENRQQAALISQLKIQHPEAFESGSDNSAFMQYSSDSPVGIVIINGIAKEAIKLADGTVKVTKTFK